MPGVPLVMTRGKDPYPLRLANQAAPRAAHGESAQTRGKERAVGALPEEGRKKKQEKWSKNKNREEGTRSGSLCLRTQGKKKRKQRAAREEERKEKLRVRVDRGQLTVHPIKMLGRETERGDWETNNTPAGCRFRLVSLIQSRPRRYVCLHISLSVTPV